MNTAIIGLGSNIEPEKHTAAAVALMKTQFTVTAISRFVHTAPLGITDQADFLNGAVRLKTEQGEDDCRRILKSIEDRLGRDRNGPKFGPRTIDLDIIVWNLTVVDPDYYTRDFIRTAVDELLEEGEELRT